MPTPKKQSASEAIQELVKSSKAKPITNEDKLIADKLENGITTTYIDQPAKAGEIQEKRDKKGRFLPGVSGNPTGNPPGATWFKKRILPIIEEKVKTADGKTTMEAGQAMIRGVVRRAIAGDTSAFREIVDRVDGKAIENKEISGEITVIQLTL